MCNKNEALIIWINSIVRAKISWSLPLAWVNELFYEPMCFQSSKIINLNSESQEANSSNYIMPHQWHRHRASSRSHFHFPFAYSSRSRFTLRIWRVFSAQRTATIIANSFNNLLLYQLAFIKWRAKSTIKFPHRRLPFFCAAYFVRIGS